MKKLLSSIPKINHSSLADFYREKSSKSEGTIERRALYLLLEEWGWTNLK